MANSESMSSSTWTVLILFFCLIGLIVLLVFLYKKLNKETNGEYTLRRMVYKEGGVRDRMRGAALTLGTCLGVQLWPRGDFDEDGEEMQEVQDEEGHSEEGGSQGSDSDGDDQHEEDNVELCGKTEGKGGDSSDDSSLGSLEEGEQTRLTDGGAGEKGEKQEENEGYGKGKGEASAGAGLLIDLKQFSGSATWSVEEGGEGNNCDITPL